VTARGERFIAFGREVCGDLEAALRREWIVTNGLGGYASGTLAGVNTRRYHGLLVAALRPPVDRRVLVAGLSEWTVLDDRPYPLSTHEFGDGTIDSAGFRYIESFRLDGMLPVWTYAFEDVKLEKRVWMTYGGTTAYVAYRLLRGDRPAVLRITPLLTDRDFHALGPGGWQPEVRADGSAVTVQSGATRPPYRLIVPGGRFRQDGVWWRRFLRREETARGLDDLEDLYAPGVFEVLLRPGGAAALVATGEAIAELDAERAFAAAQARQAALVRQAGAGEADPIVRQLTIAADQFIVRREGTGLGSGAAREAAPGGATGGAAATILAGYHWFNDWGRDTMIALPGLTLSTGRFGDAAAILRTFAGLVRDGLVPNSFPDYGGAAPSYNTVDASLWFIAAAGAYDEAVDDAALLDDVWPVVREIVERYIAGTRYGIGMDPRDALLRAGEPGLQVTWMDVKVGDTVVTPRIGKPVEINALWYNALRTAAVLLTGRDDAAAARYDGLAGRAQASFRTRFATPGGEMLADVVDGVGGDDFAPRPNQIFAVSLPFPLLEAPQAFAVVRAVGRMLATTYGLRSLAPGAAGYRGTYAGDPLSRDTAYHEGTAWAWLIGPYAEAYHRVTGDAAGALDLLRPFVDHLRDAGLGTVSEIFDGDPPHRPRGCIAQAWSVAEVLRVWRKLSAPHQMEAVHAYAG
jgi:predicted glycogen debranching enzyme